MARVAADRFTNRGTGNCLIHRPLSGVALPDRPAARDQVAVVGCRALVFISPVPRRGRAAGVRSREEVLVPYYGAAGVVAEEGARGGARRLRGARRRRGVGGRRRVRGLGQDLRELQGRRRRGAPAQPRRVHVPPRAQRRRQDDFVKNAHGPAAARPRRSNC